MWCLFGLDHCPTYIYCLACTEMQGKLDHEKMCRKQAEDAKLEMEKKKNELLVDLDQIRSQSTKLAGDLQGNCDVKVEFLRCPFTL